MSGLSAGRVLICLLALGMLSACATDRRVAPSAQYPAYKPTDAGREKENQTVPEPGFEEVRGEKKNCIASWYGRDFHGRPTASGETFDMFALTCAHKEYPLGTKVKVTNRSNGREVDCIINDRGPFVEGRDIDLSYAAANRIGLIGPGVAPVEVEPLGRYTRYIKEVKFSRLNGSMVTIQIGSFREEANAARLRNGLELH
jgi:rare lipoprotein A